MPEHIRGCCIRRCTNQRLPVNVCNNYVCMYCVLVHTPAPSFCQIGSALTRFQSYLIGRSLFVGIGCHPSNPSDVTGMGRMNGTKGRGWERWKGAKRGGVLAGLISAYALLRQVMSVKLQHRCAVGYVTTFHT